MNLTSAIFEVAGTFHACIPGVTHRHRQSRERPYGPRVAPVLPNDAGVIRTPNSQGHYRVGVEPVQKSGASNDAAEGSRGGVELLLVLPLLGDLCEEASVPFAAWEAQPSRAAAHAGCMQGNRARRRLIQEHRRGLRRPMRPAGEARGLPWVALLAAAPGIAALVALGATYATSVQTARQVRLAEQGQLTTRFNDATTNLGSDKEPVAFGGIYALDRIMVDSPKDQPRVISVLSSYVRGKRSVPEEGKFRPLSGRVPEPPREVTAVARVLASRPSGKDGRGQVDLSYADLHGLKLTPYKVDEAQRATTPGQRGQLPPKLKLGPVNLSFADLRFTRIVRMDLDESLLLKANLTCSDLLDVSMHRTNLEFARLDSIRWTNVRMQNADLTKAKLRGAVLENVDLTGADLNQADLTEAQLTNVNLTGADLRGAQLTNVNLTGARLGGARLDGARLTGVTGLPTGDRPAPPLGTGKLPAACDNPVNVT